MKWIREQFESLAIGPRKVGRGAVHDVGLNSSRPQLGHESFPLFGADGNGDVMEPPEHFTVCPEIKTGKVEVGQVVAVADVEEEMGGAAVVPVLEQFDQGELEEVLVELHRPLAIAAQHGKVVQ